MVRAVFGCTLEPQDPKREMNIMSSGGEVKCLMASFSNNAALRWPLAGSLKVLQMKRVMTQHMQKMLVHSLAREACRARLHQASIWKGMHASLFVYHVHPNAMKALISFWNHPTHTILTRTGEMGISLDVVEIGLPLWGEIYDKHIPP